MHAVTRAPDPNRLREVFASWTRSVIEEMRVRDPVAIGGRTAWSNAGSALHVVRTLAAGARLTAAR